MGVKLFLWLVDAVRICEWKKAHHCPSLSQTEQVSSC